MEKKTIAIIYDSCSNPPAIQHNQHTLEELFEGYVTTTNYYFDQLTPTTMIKGDAFLLSNEALLTPLRPYISDFKKIILMKRSIQQAAIPIIMEIPEGTDVLVVNDSFNSSVHTAHALYKLGISHLNLIPYNPEADATGIYRQLQYALTPGEGHLVPTYIPNIIDILYRVISFDTLLQLSEILQLTNDMTSRNLIKHLNSVAEQSGNYFSSFLNSHLKTQILNLVVRKLTFAILVVNTEFHPIYSNELADQLFRLKSSETTKNAEAQAELKALLSTIENNTIIEFNDISYMAETTTIRFMDQLMGYCYILHSESSIREMELNMSRQYRQNSLFAKYHFQDILHISSVMDKTILIAKRAADTDHTVLIHGESGTGKELLAQSIHNYSNRRNYPFVAINCNTLPESLLESQLFGYAGGSFTGAEKKGKPGLFEQANHGTIFLDEIGDISPNLQVQLLRVLQERQIMRIGSDKIIDLDVRVIAASNQNLEKLLELGKFRDDLFYRLSIIPIDVPPLRQRKEDILPLVSVFLGKHYEDLTDKQREALCAYDWPGNVRQLENAAKYYETLGTLPKFLYASEPAETSQPANREKMSSQTLDMLLLSIISAATEPFHGIGRSSIQIKLREQGIHIGEGKLRQMVAKLKADELITVANGRGGCRITDAGKALLNE